MYCHKKKLCYFYEKVLFAVTERKTTETPLEF